MGAAEIGKVTMTIECDASPRGDDRAGEAPASTSYAAYSAARERFLAHLRADCEVRRLEAALRLTPPDRADRPGGSAR